MNSLDALKNFALFEFKSNPGMFGVAFAVLRENNETFLVAKSTGGKDIDVLTIHCSNMEVKHYSKWEEIMDINPHIQQAFTYAYHSSPEDWPCGFARTIFDRVVESNSVTIGS